MPKPDFTEKMTLEHVNFLNDAVRENPPDLATRQAIAAYVGVHPETVRKWFTLADSRARLVRLNYEGRRASRGTEDNDQMSAKRMLIAQLLSGEIKGDLFTGKERTNTGVENSFVQIVEKIRTLSTDKFVRGGLTGFDFFVLDGQYHWTLKRKNPLHGEFSDFMNNHDKPDSTLVEVMEEESGEEEPDFIP